MNILDKIASVLSLPELKLGYMPDKPDTLTALYEYDAAPPEHHFGGADFVHGVQARCRSLNSAEAYSAARRIADAIGRYHDDEISIIQATPILDIGRDDANPPRQEYTVNFKIRRL